MNRIAAYLCLLAAAGLSAYCFSTDRPVLGAINAALAVANVVTLSKI